jgi:hypothetical protein
MFYSSWDGCRLLRSRRTCTASFSKWPRQIINPVVWLMMSTASLRQVRIAYIVIMSCAVFRAQPGEWKMETGNTQDAQATAVIR